MSAIAGIVYYDGRSVPADVLQRLCGPMSIASDQPTIVHPAPGVALAYSPLAFDAISARSSQDPLGCVEQSPVVVFDGRLDNRTDLLLSGGRRMDDGISDAQLIALLVSKFTASAILPRLVGDFALAIWDMAARELTLCRDFVGCRSLYYTARPDYIAWASNLETLTGIRGIPVDLSDEYVAGRLTFGTPPDLTPFRDIYFVPARAALRVNAGGHMTQERIWSERGWSIRYPRYASYVERMRELLIEAVAVRLRANGPVWAELSGGVDSSTIVCLAQRLIESGNVSAPRLRAMSRVFTASPESDERTHIRSVARLMGVDVTEIEDSSDYAEALRQRTTLPFSSARMYDHRVRLMEATHSQVVLSGAAGDLIMGKTAAYVVSLTAHLRDGNYAKLFNDAFAWARRSNTTLFSVLASLIANLMPPAYLARREEVVLARRLRRGNPWSVRDVAYDFALNPEFARRTRPSPALYCQDLRGQSAAKRLMIRGVRRVTASGRLANRGDVPTISFTYPYLHRPLVEFVLGIPDTLLWRPNRSRALMKDALDGLVPSSILARRDKGYAPPAVLRLMRPAAMEMLQNIDSLATVEHGYIDPKRLAEKLKEMVDGRRYESNFGALVALEMWLRGAHSGAGTPRSTAA